jgi:tetratricopeptide (TPR) repeat protein
MKLRILIAVLAFGTAALAAESGAELFQKAVTQERAAGNLEEAIMLYQRVAKEFASDRPLAAKALVQAAHCYELLGQDKQDKAVKLYEQVTRDFGDQRELSATANARLVVLRQGERAGAPATMTQRKIELPLASTLAYKGLRGYVGLLIFPTDGQRVLYKDAATGALMISDLARQDKRIVLKLKADETIENIFPSRDFSSVIVLLGVDSSRKPVVLKTDGTGYREFPYMVAGLRDSPGGTLSSSE